MSLSRLGYGSKAVVTGDVTQIDLPAGKASGLKHAMAILADVRAIRFIWFNEKDVVRHRLVQDIITAYERAGAAEAERGTEGANGGAVVGNDVREGGRPAGGLGARERRIFVAPGLR